MAYTLDGGDVGELSSETFAADKAIVRFQGVSIHPGTAFHAMVNASTLATQFVGLLPAHTRTPETTKDREGFIHLYQIQGTSAKPIYISFCGISRKKNFRSTAAY